MKKRMIVVGLPLVLVFGGLAVFQLVLKPYFIKQSSIIVSILWTLSLFHEF